MRRPGQPAFLAKRGYRLRRLMDAVRFLPFAGLVLILLPILWQPAASPRPDTARGWVYLFLVWAGLIVTAFLMARPLRRALDREEAGRPAEDAGES